MRTHVICPWSTTARSSEDIVMYKFIKNPTGYMFFFLQDDILSLCKWITDNFPTLSYLKSCYVLFTGKRHPTLPAIVHFGDHLRTFDV